MSANGITLPFSQQNMLFRPKNYGSSAEFVGKSMAKLGGQPPNPRDFQGIAPVSDGGCSIVEDSRRLQMPGKTQYGSAETQPYKGYPGRRCADGASGLGRSMLFWAAFFVLAGMRDNRRILLYRIHICGSDRARSILVSNSRRSKFVKSANTSDNYGLHRFMAS